MGYLTGHNDETDGRKEGQTMKTQLEMNVSSGPSRRFQCRKWGCNLRIALKIEQKEREREQLVWENVADKKWDLLLLPFSAIEEKKDMLAIYRWRGKRERDERKASVEWEGRIWRTAKSLDYFWVVREGERVCGMRRVQRNEWNVAYRVEGISVHNIQTTSAGDKTC